MSSTLDDLDDSSSPGGRPKDAVESELRVGEQEESHREDREQDSFRRRKREVDLHGDKKIDGQAADDEKPTQHIAEYVRDLRMS